MLKPGGRLILSGFTVRNLARVTKAFALREVEVLADGDWRCVGCDPEGLELQLDRTALRLPFPQRVRAPGVLRQVLKQLAEEARAAA